MLIGVIAEESLLPLVGAPERVIDGGPFAHFLGPDQFWQARIRVIGFIAPGLVDETTVIGAETIGRSYATQDYQGIFPDLFADDATDTFYDFSHGFIPILRPSAWYDLDFHPPADVGTNTQAVRPLGAFTDVDVFFSPLFKHGIAPVLIGSDDIIRAQIVRRDGDAFVLLSAEFTDIDTFYAPAPSPAMLPGVFTDNDVFYSPTQGQTLFPSAFADNDVFYAPLARHQLLPSLAIDSDIFIGPELRRPGNMELVVDDDIIRAPGVTFAPLLAPLITEADVFFSALIGENPPLEPNDEVVDFQDTFYVATITFAQSLFTVTWTDVDDIKSVPSVALGQPLFPALFNETDTFFTPELPQVLTDAFYNDADAFFAPVMKFDQFLTPGLVSDADSFFVPTTAAIAGTMILTGSRPGVGSAIVASTPNKTQLVSNIGAVT